ncbi:MAG: low affinity iron permease family protein [Daejeonella sp.]|uniref:low affinity iron permease family protein n=1 Tax=Daejeonella sp. JGW-45 TaxID=3034148 RepID=UPI0023EADDFD|nr:low affinity iron permease family protein [Daejeonella sp. JGW-45]
MSNKKQLSLFEKFSNAITSWAGSPYAFSTAFVIVIVWAACGPLFNFSETWQLVINTGTTIITFLMVFLIQKSQNKDNKAIQLKLNELIAADERTSNRMVDLEDMTEEELDKLHKFYERLSDLAEKDDDIHRSRSIDAAEECHDSKRAKLNPATAGRSPSGTKIAKKAAVKKPNPQQQ